MSRRIFAALAAFLPLTCSAIPLSYQFAGRFQAISAPADGSAPTLQFPVDSLFSGHLIYDTDATPILTPAGANYEGFISSFVVKVGSQGEFGTFSLADGGFLSITNDLMIGEDPQDEFVLYGTALPFAGDAPTQQRYMGLTGYSFLHDLFPEFPALGALPALSAYDSGLNLFIGTQLAGGNGSDATAQVGRVTEWRLAERGVPEPDSLALLAIGMLSILVARRRIARPS